MRLLRGTWTVAAGRSQPGLSPTLAVAANRIKAASQLRLRQELLLSSPLMTNHGFEEEGRDLWRPPSPSPLLERGQPEQTAQGCIQSGSDDREGRSLRNPSGQSVP